MKLAEKALRLRERITMDKSFESFDESETLQLILTYANIKRDPEEVANNLLETFGSLKGVLEARSEQLMNVDGVGAMAVGLLTMIVPLTRVYEKACMQDQGKIGNAHEAESFTKSLLMGERVEKFYVICLNAKCKLIGFRCISTGSLSEVSAYPRLVMETALNYNAHSVLLSHNHPGGTCAPSPEDISSTVQLQRLLKGVGIMVLDHIIVAGEKTYSMVQHGDIDYRVR